MRKQITSIDDLIGKTIEQTIYSHSGRILISFTDNTFISLTPYEECGSTEINISDKIEIKNIHRDELVGMKICTASEIDNYYKQKKESKNKQKELAEKRKYERLKKKFES